MKGKLIIVLLLLNLFAWHGQSSALLFSGGIPERVKKKGLRVSCWVICGDLDLDKKVESDLNKWIKMYLRERLKDLKLVDEKKVTDEVLKTIPHLTIEFKGLNGITVETELWGYDVIVEGIRGRYQFWSSQNIRFGARCDFFEFRELVRPMLDEFIYQYLSGR